MSATTPARQTVKRDRVWFAILVAIVLLAVLLRAWAALRLPLDYDEPVYLQAGYDYARALQAGDLAAVVDYAENPEHPALVKVLYGLVVLALGQGVDWQVALYAGRLLSAVFGVLAALLLALVDPLAGGLLAVHTMAVKYTSQVYLEALPLAASLASVLALARSSGGSGRDRWFWLSALALGATAASKFTYLPIVLVLAYLAIWEKRSRWYNLVLYAAVALFAFWLLNPSLWRDPAGRLADTLFFHARYSQGSRVQMAGLPWYQPLYWISRSPPAVWHPDAFFYFALDGAIFLLALPGLFWEWRERRWVVVWIAVGLLFLLVWPTKWPQYTLILTPALCLAASSGLRHIYRWLRKNEMYWDWLRNLIPTPPVSFWILGGLLVAAIVVFYTATTLQVTMGRLGWSHLTTSDSLLPSNTVYDMVSLVDAPAAEPGSAAEPDPDAEPGRDTAPAMALVTDHGAVLWTPRPTTDVPDEWLILTAVNSDLPAGRVRAIARDAGGALWFGTEAGLARYEAGDDGAAWQIFHAADLGLEGDSIYALLPGSDGRLWVGTRRGAAVLDPAAAPGRVLTTYTASSSGLPGNWVQSLAVKARPEGDVIWFGTDAGPARLDTASGQWAAFDDEFQTDVAALLVDTEGRVWAGTLGQGLAVWEGGTWRFFRTGNSGLPFSTVTALAEVAPGTLWVGVANPAEVGGALVELDVAAALAGDEAAWQPFTGNNSGYSEAEPLTIVQDPEGRWWIGTRTAGIDIYRATR